jgi:cystathionine beta-synthase
VKWAERYPRKMNIVVIICDSATRYLSKIFDDKWMQENGFLDADFGADCVADLLQQRHADIITVRPDAAVRDVVPLLLANGISQLPVVDERGKVTGIISEGDLLRALSKGPEVLDKPVRELADLDFSLVEPANSVAVLAQLLAQGKVVIVESAGKLVGILTKIDFIAYMTRRGAQT